LARFGRPDATGRSSGKRSGRACKVHLPPEGEPWVWLLRELLASDAWRAMSVNTHRLIDFLCIEHCNHAGTQNGALLATYDQLTGYGLTRSEIPSAINEAIFLGLLRVERGGRWAFTNKPSAYRLTFFADRDDRPPTNEWKDVTAEEIEARRRGMNLPKRRPKKQIPGATSRTTVVRLPEL